MQAFRNTAGTPFYIAFLCFLCYNHSEYYALLKNALQKRGI